MEEHLPFKYDDSKISKQAQLETLPQDGYITRYSKKRQIPLFTAQKLNGLLLKKLKKKVIIVIHMHVLDIRNYKHVV